MSTIPAPQFWELGNEAYHADTTAISNSGLKLVIQNPALYYYQKLSGLYSPKPKKHFEEGTALDEAILRPSRYVGEHVIHYPQSCLTAAGAKHSAKCKEFEEANPGKVCVKESDELCRWIHAIRMHKAARSLLEADCTYQATIAWHDTEFGVNRRSRFDCLHKDGALIIDLKTTGTDASPRQCASECAKWGYHRQAAFYQDAVEAMYGERVPFVFIFVAKEPPYRVETFELDDEFLRIGRDQNAKGLRTYAKCLKSGVWQPETHGRIMKLAAPRYLRWDKQWDFDSN